LKTLAESKFSIIFTSDLKPTLKNILLLKLELYRLLVYLFLVLSLQRSFNIAEWAEITREAKLFLFFCNARHFSRY
jgi:hypothetical protein